MKRVLHKLVGKHHRKFFNWFCETFYPLDKKFSKVEMNYIEYCFDLTEWFAEKPEDSDYREFSYFTYSHRVKGREVNSSRFAVGSLEHPEEAMERALEVIEFRGVSFPNYFVESDNSVFYGLGWDLEEGLFKVYFRIRELQKLPFESLQKLMEEVEVEYRQEGLVSYTFAGTQLVEEKVYVYPILSEEQLLPGTKSQALMISSVRGVISQYDVDVFDSKFWREKLNETGKKILDIYAERGYSLDTIAIDDSDNFTLYFPGAFIPLWSTFRKLKKLFKK